MRAHREDPGPRRRGWSVKLDAGLESEWAEGSGGHNNDTRRRDPTEQRCSVHL